MRAKTAAELLIDARRSVYSWDELAASLGVDITQRDYMQHAYAAVGFARPMGPNRFARPGCESGHHNYCTCDTCF